MKLRIKFAKYGSLRFVGHLDIMHYFQKAVRRAGIDIVYSRGFSPHQEMSFAQPLGLGATSEGEYMDIEVYSTPSSEEFCQRLNAVISPELRVVSVRLLPDDAKTGMAVIAAARYKVTLTHPGFSLLEGGRLLQEAPSILVTKEGKKGASEVDIVPGIFEASFRDTEADLLLSCGSVFNLKPDLVMDTLFSLVHVTYPPFGYRIHRIDLYTKTEEGFLPLEDMGTEILTSVERPALSEAAL